MSRIPLDMTDDGDDDEVELPCECCGDLTVEVLVCDGHSTPWCGRRSCELWVVSGVNFRNAPTVSWDEID